MKRIPALVTLAVAAAVTLTACGTNGTTSAGSAGATSTSPTSVAGDVNDADVTFAQTMIPHHEQAVQMAKMAQTHSTSAQVMRLAADIEAAQGPEIDTMQGWLDAWGQEQPSAAIGHDDHGMGDMDIEDMPGMMSDDDLGELSDARGNTWDRMFLTMMIAHHEGAIEMSRTEQADGSNLDAIALAQHIEADQTAEITTMRDMLRS
jgi:uncharacterized protein (DUF305 family)